MKFLHTMIRVGNLERSVDFYTKLLGMNEIKRKEYPEGRFTLVFIGYGSDEHNCPLIELTYNWDTDKYDIGNGFGHLAVGVDDIYATCDKISKHGGNVTRAPAPMKFGGGRNIAFVEDPDGYKIELIETSGE
jgi:lactoylglutathione lyase